jgi:hypothetical protein
MPSFSEWILELPLSGVQRSDEEVEVAGDVSKRLDAVIWLRRLRPVLHVRGKVRTAEVADGHVPQSCADPPGWRGYQVCSAARTRISLTATRRSRVTM